MLAVIACACGRINFDPLSDSGSQARCGAKSVSVGRSHTCMIDLSGGVSCWGYNVAGQAAPDVPDDFVLSPTHVALPAAAVQLATGNGHTCARLENDEVHCWGDNNSGQLGIGNYT